MNEIELALQLIQSAGSALGIEGWVRDRSTRRSSEALDAILAESHPTLREFVEFVLDDFRLEEMVATLLRASEVTANDYRLRLLRRIVAAGLRDDADLDELHFLEMAAVRLGEPHLRVLHGLDWPKEIRNEWTMYPKAGELLEPILSLLEAEGLIARRISPSITNPGREQEDWIRTAFGSRLIHFLDTE